MEVPESHVLYMGFIYENFDNYFVKNIDFVKEKNLNLT